MTTLRIIVVPSWAMPAAERHDGFAVILNMYGPEAARGWTMERSWIVPDGFGRTTMDAMKRCGI